MHCAQLSIELRRFVLICNVVGIARAESTVYFHGIPAPIRQGEKIDIYPCDGSWPCNVNPREMNVQAKDGPLGQIAVYRGIEWAIEDLADLEPLNHVQRRAFDEVPDRPVPYHRWAQATAIALVLAEAVWGLLALRRRFGPKRSSVARECLVDIAEDVPEE